MIKISDEKLIACATYILFALPIAIALSPPLTGLLELFLYTIFISTPGLRKRFLDAFQQPTVLYGILFAGFIILSSLWSQADWDIKIEHITSWRKILLLPIALSLTTSNHIKDKFLFAFIVSVTFFALASWLLYAMEMKAIKLPNALLRNHATQGMVFFVAAFSSAWILFYKKNISKKYKISLTFALIILLSNSFLITTSRSAYIIGIVLTVCFSLYPGSKKSILFAILSLSSILFLLYLSPNTHKQIEKVISEISHMEKSEDLTSAGARVTFWKYTIPVIQSSPIIGHGLKSLPIEYAKQVEEVVGWQGIVTRDPHNQYLLILAEQGAIGLILFFAFIASCFFQKTDGFYKKLGTSVLLGWMATSLFNGHFSASIEGKFILLWCGAMLATKKSSEE